jgi:hypothetical protein
MGLKSKLHRVQRFQRSVTSDMTSSGVPKEGSFAIEPAPKHDSVPYFCFSFPSIIPAAEAGPDFYVKPYVDDLSIKNSRLPRMLELSMGYARVSPN